MTDVQQMFYIQFNSENEVSAVFDQDLSLWDVNNVSICYGFLQYVIIRQAQTFNCYYADWPQPNFTNCTP